MDITPRVGAGINMISGYGASGFRINNRLFVGHIILSLDIADKWELVDNAQPIESLRNYMQIAEIIKKKKRIDNIILLVGTGEESISLPLNIKNYFNGFDTFPETMSTPAACRTYNVLAAEGRSVYALLLSLQKLI